MGGTATWVRRAAGTFVECACLAAIVAIPLLFNARADRAFEEPKVLLLRALASVILSGLVVWIAADGRTVSRIAKRPAWRVPLLAPLLLLAGAYAVSTAFSISPHVSFWGAYRRTQGLYTWLSYVAVFVAILLVAHRREHTERVVTMAILSSVPAAVYGIVQHFGGDPLRWDPGGDRIGRIVGTAGNPIFFSAFLIMVVPVTLARLIRHAMEAGVARTNGPALLARTHRRLAATYALVLGAQTLSIVYARSLGPLLGLGAGLTLFGLLFTFRYRLWRGFVSLIAAASATAVFLVIFNLPQTPFARLYDVKYVNDLARIASLDQGTGKVRRLIWEGTLALLAADPLRDLIGYGPDTMPLAYEPFYPPTLMRYETSRATPDRAHNETLDALVTIGLVGCAAQWLVLGSLCFHALRWLGMIRTLPRRRAFFAVVAASGLLGGVMPVLIDGTFVFAALGLGTGVALGVLLSVVVNAFLHWNDRADVPPTDHLLLAGLLAAVLAHVVETQVGIAVVATRLYFFTWAALAVIIGMRAERTAGAGTPVALDTKSSVDDAMRIYGAIVAVALVVLTFDFYQPGVALFGQGLALPGLLLATWVTGTLFALGETAVVRAAVLPHRAIALYATSSLGLWCAFTVTYVWWTAAPSATGAVPLDSIRSFGQQVAHANTLLYVFVMLCVAMPAIATARAASVHDRAAGRGRWPWPLYAAAVASAVICVRVNLDAARADSASGLATVYAQRGELAAAESLYSEASDLQPTEAAYAMALGRVRMAEARTATREMTPSDATLFSAAETTLQHAQRLNPLDLEPARDLGRLHRLWADALRNPVAQAEHAAQATQFYGDALQRSPQRVDLRNEWAKVLLERGDAIAAATILDQSLALDAGDAATYCLRAAAYLQLEKFEAALADYQRAGELRPNLPEAWTGKALALVRLNRPQEAIAANHQAAQLAPRDVTTHWNLALLYRNTGQPQLARKQVEAALRVASPADTPALQQLLEQLDAESTPADSAP